MTVSGGRAGVWVERPSSVSGSVRRQVDPAPALPQLGDHIELTGLHAEGATCRVYKGHHVALDLGVAVKILRPELAADPRYLERMRIEAQVLPRLRSAHIVHCFDRGTTSDGLPYTVLEFLRGDTLEVLLDKLSSFDELSAVELTLELFEALAVVHAQGVVHRDVSLRNLIVHRPAGDVARLKLVDFGFAWILPDAPESAPERSETSDAEHAVGTPRFAAPEVALGRNDIDARADLYSAGVVLYTLLAGRDPFADCRTVDAVLEAHAGRSVPPLAKYVSRLSPELDRIVMRLLEKDRRARFPTAREAAEALQSVAALLREQRASRISSPPAPPALLLPGSSFGPYVVEQAIRESRFWESYEATQREQAYKSPHDLSVLKARVPTDRGRRALFRERAQALATIRHPNLPIVHDAGEHAGRPWLATALVGGVTLRQHLELGGSLAPAIALRIAYGLANALRQLHRLGIVHGHVDPDHVLVTPSGNAYLLHGVLDDLLSDELQRESARHPDVACYASPEAITGAPLDARSDLFSWGTVVREMLTAREQSSTLANPGASWQGLVAHLYNSSASPSSRLSAEAKPLWQVLDAVTDRLRELRPGNFEDVCADLDATCHELIEAPLVVTSDYALGLSDDVAVAHWRTVTPAAVSHLREMLRWHARRFTGAVVILEEGSCARLRDLEPTLRSLLACAPVTVLVAECRELRSQRPASPEVSSLGWFSSVATAADWLNRYHPNLAGLSTLTATAARLRRQLDQAPEAGRSERRSGFMPRIDRALVQVPSMDVRVVDDTHAVAICGTTLVQIWRGRATAQAYAEVNRIGRELVAASQHSTTSLFVVERSSPPPDGAARKELATFRREILKAMSLGLIVAEGGAFRASLVRATNLALPDTGSTEPSPEVVQDVRTAVRLLAPRLGPGIGEDQLLDAVERLRDMIGDTHGPARRGDPSLTPDRADPHGKSALAMRAVDSVLVLRQGTTDPSDDEWNEFLSLLRAHLRTIPNLKVFVVSDGGGPNVAQRRALEETLRGTSIRAAGISDSVKGRFIGAMISTFNPGLRTFRRSQSAAAYEHIDVSADQIRKIEAALAELEAMVRN